MMPLPPIKPPLRARLPRPILGCVLLAGLLSASPPLEAVQPALPELGRDAEVVPAAPFVAALPSVSRAGQRLRPLLERMALALPELDPSMLFVELRVRLGIDLFDDQSLIAAGLDPTGPLYVVDAGDLDHPVLLFRLLPDGEKAFEHTVVQRVAKLDQLPDERTKHSRGIASKLRSASPSALPRFAYAFFQGRVGIAPNACARGHTCVAEALRPRRTLLKDATAKRLLTQLPSAPLLIYALRAALQKSPSRSGRNAATELQALALAADVDQGLARVRVHALPNSVGRRRAKAWPPLSGRAAEEIRGGSALALQFGIAPGRFPRALRALPYYEAMRQLLAAQGLQVENELTAIADGGGALFLLDLEPQLPGLDDKSHLDDRDLAFFVEHGLWLPIRDRSRADKLLRALDNSLAKRSGRSTVDKIGGAMIHSYAEAGRVVSYAIVADALLVASGPGAMEDLRAALRSPHQAAPPDTLFHAQADSDKMRAAMGRVGLLGVGENRDMRTVWVVRQASAPMLRHLGQTQLTLSRRGQLLVLEARSELRGELPRRR